MMKSIKKVILIISALIYILILGLLLPFILIILDLYDPIYDWNEEMATNGIFFFLYLMGTFFFFPLIYSTLIEEKLSFSIKDSRKNAKKPRFYASILFIIGIPIMIWLIIIIIGYYSISEFSGGMGELVFNGFLVMLIMLMYFCLIPALVLSLKKGKNSLHLNL